MYFKLFATLIILLTRTNAADIPKVLVETDRLLVCEFYDEVNSTLLDLSINDPSPYIEVDKLSDFEVMMTNVIREKQLQTFKADEILFNGNTILTILTKAHQLVGTYSIAPIDEDGYCELSLYILPPYRGCGYMPEAVLAINKTLMSYVGKVTYWPETISPQILNTLERHPKLTKELFLESFNLIFAFKAVLFKGVFAEIESGNTSSIKAIEKTNMQCVEKKYPDEPSIFYFPPRLDKTKI